MLSGFTLVRNAVKLDFPIVPAIRSVLEVCDEVVVNVGKSEDETRDLVAAVGDPRVRIIDSEWDFTKKNEMRSEEHTSELQSRPHLVCRLLLEKKKNKNEMIVDTSSLQ